MSKGMGSPVSGNVGGTMIYTNIFFLNYVLGLVL